jgi:hypothetical protein
MIAKLQTAYPQIKPGRVRDRTHGTAAPATAPRATAQVGRVHQVANVVAATLSVAILILAFVVLSLGLGAEGHTGVGPDRPPQPVAPAPAPPPDPGSLLVG